MEDALAQDAKAKYEKEKAAVLILVLMEDALARRLKNLKTHRKKLS